jgi:AraC family transcriptional regulator
MIRVTYGATHLAKDTRSFALLESVYSPGFSIPPHAHEHPVCVLVLEGIVSATSSSGPLRCAPNTLRTVPAGEYHSNRYGSERARCFLVAIKPHLADSIGVCTGVLQDEIYRDDSSRAVRYMRRMYHEFFNDDSAMPLAVEGLFLELIADVARSVERHHGRAPRWLCEAREILRDSSSTDISITGLGRQLGVHPVHLARVFRSHYGCTPSDYVRAVRVERAGAALRETDASLSSIALDAGYADQSHFTRVFRKAMGVTPARYRQSARRQQMP